VDGINCGFHVMVNLYLLLHELPLDSIENMDMGLFRMKALLASMDGYIFNHPARIIDLSIDDDFL
jgi:hypothetical protein